MVVGVPPTNMFNMMNHHYNNYHNNNDSSLHSQPVSIQQHQRMLQQQQLSTSKTMSCVIGPNITTNQQYQPQQQNHLQQQQSCFYEHQQRRQPRTIVPNMYQQGEEHQRQVLHHHYIHYYHHIIPTTSNYNTIGTSMTGPATVVYNTKAVPLPLPLNRSPIHQVQQEQQQQQQHHHKQQQKWQYPPMIIQPVHRPMATSIVTANSLPPTEPTVIATPPGTHNKSYQQQPTAPTTINTTVTFTPVSDANKARQSLTANSSHPSTMVFTPTSQSQQKIHQYVRHLDIILGCWEDAWDHPGNIRFRKIIMSYQPIYAGSTFRLKRHYIDIMLKEILDHGRTRFLRRVRQQPLSPYNNNDTYYEEVSNDVAKRKIVEAIHYTSVLIPQRKQESVTKKEREKTSKRQRKNTKNNEVSKNLQKGNTDRTNHKNHVLEVNDEEERKDSCSVTMPSVSFSVKSSPTSPYHPSITPPSNLHCVYNSNKGLSITTTSADSSSHESHDVVVFAVGTTSKRSTETDTCSFPLVHPCIVEANKRSSGDSNIDDGRSSNMICAPTTANATLLVRPQEFPNNEVNNDHSNKEYFPSTTTTSKTQDVILKPSTIVTTITNATNPSHKPVHDQSYDKQYIYSEYMNSINEYYEHMQFLSSVALSPSDES